MECKNFVRQLLRALDKEGWSLMFDSAFAEQRQVSDHPCFLDDDGGVVMMTIIITMMMRRRRVLLLLL